MGRGWLVASQTKPAAERGVALFVALIILVIISILGVAAMRSSISNARIATGIQANNLSFQAAQTAITAATSEMENGKASDANNLFYQLLRQNSLGKVVKQYRCIMENGKADQAVCTTNFVDARGLVQSQSSSIMEKEPTMAQGYSLNSFGYYTMLVAGEGSVPSMNMTLANVQELAVLGPMPQGTDVTLNP